MRRSCARVPAQADAGKARTCHRRGRLCARESDSQALGGDRRDAALIAPRCVFFLQKTGAKTCALFWFGGRENKRQQPQSLLQNTNSAALVVAESRRVRGRRARRERRRRGRARLAAAPSLLCVCVCLRGEGDT